MSQLDADAVTAAIESVSRGNCETFWLTGYKGESDSSSSEMLFFVKPELTSNPDIKLTAVLDIILDKFTEYGVSIQACGVLGAGYLERHNVIAQHYGVIHTVSSTGLAALTDETKSAICKAFNTSSNAENVILGGHQFLSRFPYFSPEALSVLWDNLNFRSERLAPGTYGMEIDVLSERIVLLNGFSPYQVRHFTATGRTILVMVVRSATAWSKLRNDMIGDTDPNVAAAGSIRSQLLEKQTALNIPSVNKGLNGVHLSAGPLEALVEIERFCRSRDANETQHNFYCKTSFGQALIKSGFSDGEIRALASNPLISVSSAQDTIISSAYDLTECNEPDDAIALLIHYRDQLKRPVG